MVFSGIYCLADDGLFANILSPQEYFLRAIASGMAVLFVMVGMASFWRYVTLPTDQAFPDKKPYTLFIALVAAGSLTLVLDIASLYVPNAGIEDIIKVLSATLFIFAIREYLVNDSYILSSNKVQPLRDENQAFRQELAACRRLESELYQNQQLLNNAFEYALIGAAILSPEGEWIRVNPALCQILGYSEAEILQKNFRDITYPEDLEADQRHVEQLLSNKISSCQFEKRYIHKQGHLIWVSLSVSLVKTADGQPLYFIAQIDNISERKQAEADLNTLIEQLKLSIAERSTELEKAYKSLQTTSAQYQDLYDNAPDLYLSVEADSSKILRCNQTLIRELGYTHEEIIGKSVFELYHPDFQFEAKKAFQCFAETGETKDVYLVLQRKDGTTLDVSLNARGFRNQQGKLMYSRSSWRDISERKRLENQLKQINADLDEQVQNRTRALRIAVQSLKESQLRLELALEVSGGSWWDWNLPTEDMWWSSQFYRILGYEEKDLQTSLQTWQRLIHPDDLPNVMRSLEAHLQDPSIPYALDYRVRTQSGPWKWISTLGKVVDWDQQGEPLRMLGMHHDISDRKQAEENLKHINAELARSNQELSHFAYVASHDLQEPLRKIGSFSDLLAERYQGQLDEQGDRYIRYITDGATRMQGLIDDLLNYSRVGRAELEIKPTALGSIVETVQSDLERVIHQRHAEIVVGPLPTVAVDPGKIRQVFQNLITNAIKYCQADIPRIHIQANRNHNLWTISVQDNGIGIDPQMSERIFVIFQRLHHREEYSGTGIGLAICKKIVERHGGHIWVKSAEGQGAIFSFTLPIKD